MRAGKRLVLTTGKVKGEYLETRTALGEMRAGEKWL